MTSFTGLKKFDRIKYQVVTIGSAPHLKKYFTTIQALLSEICFKIWGGELSESERGGITYCDNLVYNWL